MDRKFEAERRPWDAYAVWQILVHCHPVKVENPAGSCGHIDRTMLAEFCESIADYPDYLQDTLLIIAHAEGFHAAMDALDRAVRKHLAARPLRLAGASARTRAEFSD